MNSHPNQASSYTSISFLSDYGLQDEFVGVVKAVIADIAPTANVIDLTHNIPPFDVRAGSLALARSVQYLPTGIVLAVVDPGVGTSRRGVAIEVGDGAGVFVGPDNGLLAPAVALAGGAGRSVELTNVEYQLEAPGITFAGRDIFAPVAAHLCNGVPLTELGPLIDADLLMPGVVPLPQEIEHGMQCEVTWVDQFGNCQLNAGGDDIVSWGSPIKVTIGENIRACPVVRTYADIGQGGLGLVVDSYGMLSLATDRGSAAFEMSIGVGDIVLVERRI